MAGAPASAEQQWLAVVQVLPQLLEVKHNVELCVPETPPDAEWQDLLKQKAGAMPRLSEQQQQRGDSAAW
jgi:hypothetical protein